MTILFEAWRRAHEKDPRLAETLGAPMRGLRARAPLLPWLLCLLLVACVVGLGVYVWLDWGRLHAKVASAARSPAASVAASPRLPVTRGQSGGAKNAAVNGSPASAPVRSALPKVVPIVEPVTQKPAAKSAAGKSATAQVQADESSRAAPAAATVPLAAVPEDVREAMPALAVIAHVWNANPAASFLMIGNRVYRVGDEIAPGLRLLAITHDGEIVAFRGYRIALP
ncbi:MAG: general secretion pathway protein GspB [Gammaproteobacteria bacterium]